jgi:tRNA G18 (ribose-2'-O)-methylase SpoU
VGIIAIDDLNDERLDDYRNIPDPELVERRGVFVAEGRLVVQRLLENSNWTTRSVMLTDTAMASMRAVLERAPALPIYVVPQPVMNGVAGFNIHRGCLAIGERPPARRWQDVMARATRLVALERVGDADNVGSVFRAAAAFGADGVLLGPSCADPLYRKAIRTSMGAVLTVVFTRAEPWPGVLRDLRDRGWAIVGMTPSPAAAPLGAALNGIDSQPVMLVLGHEGDGLTAETLAMCDRQARIPIAATVDSLNVATAAAIGLYELTTRGK